MATSQDKAQKFKEALRGKGTQIFLGAMALLLAGRIYFFMQESGFQNAEIQHPREITTLPDAVKPETLTKVSGMINTMPEFTTTTYYTVSQVSMFDAKAVQNADSLVNRANQFVGQAQDAYNRKNWTEAELMVKEALKVNPNQGNAQALRDKINVAKTSETLARSQPTPAPGAPAAQATPATGASPAAGAPPAK